MRAFDRIPWVVRAAKRGVCLVGGWLALACHSDARKVAEPAPQRAPTESAAPEASWEPVSGGPSKTSTRWLWWEAEQPKATDFPPHHAFEPDNDAQAALLSGGRWVGVDGSTPGTFLEYEVEVPAGGADAAFEFYARKFWQHGPFRWHFDDQPWQHCGRDIHLLDAVMLRVNVQANWVYLGSVALGPGKHQLRIELDEPKSPVAFDAFLLTENSFAPRGILKPDQAYAAAPAGWSVFDPAGDTFQPTPVDLRSLNQPRSGDDGFVAVRGSELVFAGSGKPVRFWGVNAGRAVLALSLPQMQRYARRLAKFGVNLVRLDAGVQREHAVREIDEDRIDRIQRFATALRDNGIYLGLSTYFPLTSNLFPADGFAGYAGTSPFSLSYFNTDFQQMQRVWWQRLLTKPRPDGGVALAQDPTLAYVELVNEDSTLFWTFSPYATIPAQQMSELETRLGRWLGNKYGSIKQAFDAWAASAGSAPKAERGDVPAAGRVGFVGLWEIANQPSLRGRDTAEFLTILMRDYYESLNDYIKHDLGYAGLSVCSNWHTGDEVKFGLLDNWANSVCDVLDRHAYMQGAHAGDAAEYSVREHQTYADRAVLLPSSAGKDDELVPPFLEPRYNGKPAFVSEVGWPWPNRFRAEGPWVVAGYGRLTGLDAPMWFASSLLGWAGQLDKFEIQDPAILGQFPAAALAFRGGYIQEGPTVAQAAFSERELFELPNAPLVPTLGLDTLRASDREFKGSARSASGAIHPAALLAGAVDISVGASLSNAAPVAPVPAPLSTQSDVIESVTKQLSWNVRNGILTIHTDQLEVAAGFLGKQRSFSMARFELESQNEFGTLALISLDGEPLGRSRRMLLQVMSEVTNSGWRVANGKIEASGHPPILLRNIEATLRWRGDRAAPDAALKLRITALDANGYPVRTSRPGTGRLRLLPDSLYYLVEESANE